jgi:hypothetical protein
VRQDTYPRRNYQSANSQSIRCVDVSSLVQDTLSTTASPPISIAAAPADAQLRFLALAAMPTVLRRHKDGRLLATARPLEMLPDIEMAVHRLRQCAVVCMLDAVPWVQTALTELGEEKLKEVGEVFGAVVEVHADNGDSVLALPESEVTQLESLFLY